MKIKQVFNFYLYVENSNAVDVVENNRELFSFYPNPVVSTITITTKKSGDIIIMDENQAILYEVEQYATSGNKMSIKVDQLSKGIYFVLLKINGEIEALSSFYKK